ncbi:hypothetical protein HU200_028556 [Digitaria exilis]|uniref:Uncharacterized protein n=1 Tax=Digitaria exilis TaxID=1010633 RepID=A0A835ETS1_9POAL|nr:hypothetical protein HU200_028556 [Digitaria exilis]
MSTPTLDEYGTDLTKLANEGKLDPVVGRQKQIDQVVQILSRKGKNNPCLTGEPGVGKTAAVEGLAQLIARGDVPETMQGKKVISVDMGRFLAGTKYRGEFEERLKNLMDEIKKCGNIILFLDEVHTLVGAAAAVEGGIDAANILKPALARGELQLNLTIDRFLPDKAIDLIDEAGSLVRLRHAQAKELRESELNLNSQIIAAIAKNKEMMTHQDEVNNPPATSLILMVTKQDIRHIVSLWTGVPVYVVSTDETNKLLNMEDTLHQRIVGQDEAVTAISRAIRRARVGLNDPHRPIASFIFAGPTGVGKSELAKALATYYYGSEDAMVRVDMSELMGEARRVQAHRLAAGLRRTRRGTVDFTNTLIIMTSNIGGAAMVAGGDGRKEVVDEEMKRYFRPEFLNRLDETIVFSQLSKAEVKEIAGIMVKEVAGRVREMGIEMEVTEKFVDRVVDEGFDTSYGARPLRRAVVRLLEDTLADKVLDGEIVEGDSVTVDADAAGNVNVVVLGRDCLVQLQQPVEFVI